VLVVIGTAEIQEAVNTVNALLYTGAPDPHRLETWAAARSIDSRALIEAAVVHGRAALEETDQGNTGRPVDACSVAALAGVLLGVELERRRRDAESLPA
jgi:ElaB/YqjD/DUF883 family membrane-anchored ribosome-binding protein